MLKGHIRMARTLVIATLLLTSASLVAQGPIGTGVINGTLINKNGIAIIFNTDPGGVSLGNAGTSAVSVNFGTVSAFGPLSGGVTRPTVTATNFTVRTIFDVQVTQGGLTSTTYRLLANLSAPAPIGFSYQVDAITLTATAQTVQSTGIYSTDVPHSLDLIISRAAPGTGGPAVGTPVSTTINFLATPN